MNNSSSHPLVSVLIPCRNEEKSIRECILSLRNQQYPAESLEILVADGRSTDRTREILEELSSSIPQLRVVDNPQIIIPAALNRAIHVSRGEIVILLGAHASFSSTYVAEAVRILSTTDSDCVGGRVDTVSDTEWGKAIALAMSSPFGVGDAKFRYSDKEELVDTVAFGAYRRDVFARIGYFDENLPRNEDDEFNYRLRKAGGKILLAPTMTAQYYSRPSLSRLWRQYFGYGRGKVKVARKHPSMMRLRHFAPATFVATLVTLALASIFHSLALGLLFLLLGLYFTAAIVFSYNVAKKHGWRYLFMLPIAFLTLHLSYGFGTITGLFDALAWRLRARGSANSSISQP